MVELVLSTWLKPEDIEGDTEVCFVNEGMISDFVDAAGVRKETFEIGITFGDQESRKWTMNKTSQRAVASYLGNDTAKWVGQVAMLFLADQNVQGVMKKVIYARTPTVAPQAVPQ